jgi:hypothetical protein
VKVRKAEFVKRVGIKKSYSFLKYNFLKISLALISEEIGANQVLCSGMQYSKFKCKWEIFNLL